MTISATDADTGSNGAISYRIGTGGRGNFFVESDGRVVVSNTPSFDYDQYKQQIVQVR